MTTSSHFTSSLLLCGFALLWPIGCSGDANQSPSNASAGAAGDGGSAQGGAGGAAGAAGLGGAAGSGGANSGGAGGASTGGASTGGAGGTSTGGASTGGAGGSCSTIKAESTQTTCSDGCDNDQNGNTDCDDPDCCATRTDCGATTRCGQRSEGMPLQGYLDLNDAAVEAIDPAELPAGPQPCHAPALVSVNYAVDGDTIDVQDMNGGDAEGRVRIIGVNTPEVAHSGSDAECYGEEASIFTSYLKNHLVWLTFDAECQDSYGRLLAYVHLGIGTNDMLERQLLRRGFARAFPYGNNRTFEELFASDEAQAETSSLGLWSACQ